MRSFLIAAFLTCVSPFAALACPTPAPGIEQYVLNQFDVSPSFRITVVGGGDINLGNCGFTGGYVIGTPDFSFTFDGISGPMQFFVESPGCDTVLLVHVPGAGFYFDDDSYGNLQPFLDAAVVDGSRVDVWVGTFGPATCNATLNIS